MELGEEYGVKVSQVSEADPSRNSGHLAVPLLLRWNYNKWC